MRFRLSLLILLFGLSMLFFPEKMYAGDKSRDSKPVKVSGEGTYFLEGKDNLDFARSMAIELAKANAIESTFGSLVSSSTHSSLSWTGGEERNSFSSMTRTLQLGVWVKDLKEPEVTTFIGKDGSIGFTAKVSGLARRVTSRPVETQGQVIATMGRNDEEGMPAESLRQGAEFFFRFRAAADGYLAIYLIDENGKVFQAAPIQGVDNRLLEVKNSQTLTIRDKGVKNEAYIDDPTLKEVHNQVIFIFSPTLYSLPLCDLSSDGSSLLDYDRFHAWLQEMAAIDDNFTVTCQTIRILR